MRLKVKSCVGSISPLLALVVSFRLVFLLFWSYLPSPCLGWVFSEIILHSQKIMLKPFAPPPPSSFGVLPACTVSLSDPLSAVFISLSHKESMWKRRQNSNWCDLEGPLWWIRLPAATSTTRMGKSRKSWLASGESLFRLLIFVGKVTKVI